MLSKWLLVLVFGVSIATCARCPKGSTEDIVDGSCVAALDYSVTFTNANQVCSSLGGSLIQIKNGFQNAFASEQAGAVLTHPAFIGVVRKDSTQQWTYVDGSPLTYNRWKPGAVLNGTNGKCAEMNTADVYWHPVSCDKPRALICTFPDNLPDPVCGQNWTYSATFDACYYLRAAINRVPDYLYDFSAARGACHAMSSELISIHSQQENDFIMDFIATHASGIDCYYYQAFIGLTLINGVQAWTDGTPFDYDNRVQTNKWVYAMINETGCNVAKWDPWPDNQQLQRFLCKKAPSSLHKRISEIIASLDDKGPNKQ